MSTTISEPRGPLGDILTATVCGAFVGALLGSALLVNYTVWREATIRDLREHTPTLTVVVLRRLGPPPRENIQLLLPSVAIGMMTGALFQIRNRSRIERHSSRRSALFL